MEAAGGFTPQRLAAEQRQRLAAERLLDVKTRELEALRSSFAARERELRQQALPEALTGVAPGGSVSGRVLQALDAVEAGYAYFGAGDVLVRASKAFLAPFGGAAAVPEGIRAMTLIRQGVERGVLLPLSGGPEALLQQFEALCAPVPGPPVSLRLPSRRWLRISAARPSRRDLVMIARDVTSELRLIAGLEALEDGFALFDPQLRLISCNEPFRSRYPGAERLSSPGDSLGDMLRDAAALGIYTDALGREEAWVAERLAAAGSGAEAELRCADGRAFRLTERLTPDGGLVMLRSETTDERRRQQDLQLAHTAAEAANRAKSAFLANMSHEIRTPMNGVLGMAELLCDTDLSEEQRVFTETIRSSAEALLSIINDILDYSRLEAGRLTLRSERVDLERLVHEVAMLLQPRARSRGLDLLIDYDLFLPTHFQADPARLRQVLVNLMGNAVKFTDHGHILVRVVGMSSSEGLADLRITVEDTGIGMTPEQQAMIFTEFAQVQSGNGRAYEGAGLGLPITRGLIEAMGGGIWLESEPDRGTCFGFHLTLPVLDDSPPRDETLISLQRALVVDDLLINRTILQRQLQSAGLEVVLCHSGAGALEMLAADPGFDVVLTDHEMPGMNGVTLAQKITALLPGLPVVLLSSSGGAERTVGVAAVIAKPVLRSELFRHLRSLDAPVAPPVPVPEPLLPTRRLHLLAAEDNRVNQLVFSRMLTGFDLQLTFADTGAEAVEKWRNLQPDIIFMDISMPGMDGKDATRAIRAEEALDPSLGRVPIIALTAHALEGDEAAILAAGLDLYLTKPVRRSDILRALAQFSGPLPAAAPVGS